MNGERREIVCWYVGACAPGAGILINEFTHHVSQFELGRRDPLRKVQDTIIPMLVSTQPRVRL